MKDRYFITLADEHRRDLLLSLLDEPSLHIEIREQTPGEIGVQLVHTHLPCLEDAGLIRWDRDAQSITRGPNYEELEPLMRFLQTQQSNESRPPLIFAERGGEPIE